MADTIKDWMDEVKAYVKEAGERESENITGQDVDSLPGAEHDKDIPSGAKTPTDALKDDTIDNMKNRNLNGAEPGSDVPVVDEGYTAEESVLTPDKKPLDTADANAKEASALDSLGNSLVDMILKKKAAAPAKAQEEKQPVQKQAVQKQAAPAAQPEKITVDMGMLAKIAAITLADEEGQFAVQQALTKRAGAEFAKEVIELLEKQAAEEQAQYEFEKGAQDAESMIGDLQEAQGAQDAEAALGDAAEAQGAADAEAALAGGEGGDVGGGELSPEEAASALDEFSADEIVEAVQDLASEGTIDQETAAAITQAVSEGAQDEGAPDDISEDDVAEAITEAIESGELSEEDAQALVQAISEQSDSPEASEALAGDVAGADAGAGAEEATADPAEKAASVKKAAARETAGKLIEALRRLK